MLTREIGPTKLSECSTVNNWESETLLLDEMLEISSKTKGILDLEITQVGVQFVKDVKVFYKKTSINQKFNPVSEKTNKQN